MQYNFLVSICYILYIFLHSTLNCDENIYWLTCQLQIYLDGIHQVCMRVSWFDSLVLLKHSLGVKHVNPSSPACTSVYFLQIYWIKYFLKLTTGSAAIQISFLLSTAAATGQATKTTKIIAGSPLSNVSMCLGTSWLGFASLPQGLEHLPSSDGKLISKFTKISYSIVSEWLSTSWYIVEVEWCSMTVTLSIK